MPFARDESVCKGRERKEGGDTPHSVAKATDQWEPSLQGVVAINKHKSKLNQTWRAMIICLS